MSLDYLRPKPLLPGRFFVLPPEAVFFDTPRTGGGSTWPTANLARYFPFSLPADAYCTGVSVFVSTGASAGRNWDVGFYDTNSVRLSSQGQAQMTNGINTWAAAQMLEGGVRYYVGLSATSTSLQLWAHASTVPGMRLQGVAQEGSAGTLPATATMVQVTAIGYYWIALTLAEA